MNSISSRVGFIMAVGFLLCVAGPLFGAKSDWVEYAGGASRDYYNSAAKLRWRSFMGDWHDANGKSQGAKPYASTNVKDEDRARFVDWDVTTLVRQWHKDTHPNQGFFLRAVNNGGTIVFASREHDRAAQRPRLVLAGRDRQLEIAALADTHLSRSTYRSQGKSTELRIAGESEHVLIRFDLTDVEFGPGATATLRLYTTRQYGEAEIGVFRCSQGHALPPSDPIPGLAGTYRNDRGIADNADVIFAAGFEAQYWADRWTYAGIKSVIAAVARDDERKFEPLSGKALRVKIARGSTGALNTLFKFEEEVGREPEEIYFRYYLRLGDDWNQTLQGGKMPGISGTYGVAGWGGRKVDGTNGWSARGSFGLSVPPGNPLGGLHPIGTYCYHADMKGVYGDSWGWHLGYRGFLEKNRWYSIEQHLKLNSPGKKDGELRAWVDGRLAFEKTDIRFRNVSKLKVEQIWMNVYHGGKKPSPRDQHLFIDNVVVARKYIGPVGRK